MATFGALNASSYTDVSSANPPTLSSQRRIPITYSFHAKGDSFSCIVLTMQYPLIGNLCSHAPQHRDGERRAISMVRARSAGEMVWRAHHRGNTRLCLRSGMEQECPSVPGGHETPQSFGCWHERRQCSSLFAAVLIKTMCVHTCMVHFSTDSLHSTTNFTPPTNADIDYHHTWT